MTEIYKIGIIEDDDTKAVGITSSLNKIPKRQERQYGDVEIIPIRIPIAENKDEMIQNIEESSVDCMLVDYRLSVNYGGADLASEISGLYSEFPVFILTSYKEEVFLKEEIDAYQIFDVDAYFNDPLMEDDLNSKIIEQIRKSNKTIDNWTTELRKLTRSGDRTVEIDSRIIELDTNIERALHGKSRLPTKIKEELKVNRLNDLIESIKELLEQEECDNEN